MVLRPRHFRAIELLVGTDLLQRDVARQVGVTPRTLGRWLKDDAFQAELARRRDGMPDRLDGLRMQTARSVLLNAIRRLDAGEEKVPFKEITQLLAQIVDDPRKAAPARPDDEESDDDNPFNLTPDQAERMWAIIDEDSSKQPAAEEAEVQPESPAQDPAEAAS